MLLSSLSILQKPFSSSCPSVAFMKNRGLFFGDFKVFQNKKWIRESDAHWIPMASGHQALSYGVACFGGEFSGPLSGGRGSGDHFLASPDRIRK